MHPATRCVVSPVGDELLERVGSLHVTHGAKLFRRRNPKYHEEFADVPDLGDGLELLAAAKLEHELDHIQRFCATSYGFLVHRLHSRQVDCFFEAIQASSGNLGFPLFPRPLSASAVAADRGKASLARDFWGCRYLLSMLEATSGSLVAPQPWQREVAREAFERCVDLPWSSGVPDDVRSFAGNTGSSVPGDFAFPALKFGGARAKKVGGQGLLEFFAVSREATELRYANTPGLMDHEQMRCHLHTQAAKAWKVSAALPLIEPRIEGGWKKVGLTRRPQFPLECRVAIDLALWPPYTPDGFDAGRPWTWADIHPGWRYVRVLEYLKARDDVSYRLWTDSGEADDDWLLDLQAEVADHFGWPTPQDLAAAWLEYWLNWEASGATDKNFICDDTSRAQATVELLASRIKRPFLMVMSYPGASSRSIHWFESTITWSDTGPVTMMSPEGNEARWLERGYRLPVGFAMVNAVDIFGSSDWSGGRPAAPLVDGLRATGRGLEEAIQNYAKRHYQFDVEFGGRSGA